METPMPMQGKWTLIRPDGERYRCDSPIACLRAEMAERVSARVAVERILASVSEPDFADRHVQIGAFYSAISTDDLIDKMEGHIARLQEKVSAASTVFSFAPQNVRG